MKLILYQDDSILRLDKYDPNTLVPDIHLFVLLIIASTKLLIC